MLRRNFVSRSICLTATMRYLCLFFTIVTSKLHHNQDRSFNSTISSTTGAWKNSTVAAAICTSSSRSTVGPVMTTSSFSGAHLTRDAGDRPHFPYHLTKPGDLEPTRRSKTRRSSSSVRRHSKGEGDGGPRLINLTTSTLSSVASTIATTSVTPSAPTTPLDLVSPISMPPMTATPRATTLSSALSSVGSSSTEQDTTATTSTLSTFLSLSPVDSCYKASGGLQEDGDIDPGCGAMLAHIQSCHNSYEPGDDLVDSNQNAMFQACVCGTSKEKGFTGDSVLNKNFTGCAACLLNTKTPSFEDVSEQNEKFWDFCRSQNPFPFSFYYDLNQWIREMQIKASALYPVTPALTGVLQDASHFTTIPPLANLAYGASAPSDGSLAKVTPSLTTFTRMRSNPTGSGSVPATVTSLEAWVPTQPGKAWNSDSAAHSEAQAVSSRLTSALCYGRGPGQCPKDDTSLNQVPVGLLWLLVAFAAALPPVVMLIG